MKQLMKKELGLTAMPITFIFILFGIMAIIPGYPILLAAFFSCLGLFFTFQSARESSDILFSVMLPVAKRDIVRAKYRFAALIQMATLLLFTIITLLRMAFLSRAAVYTANAMMNANFFAAGWLFIIFAEFNCLFIGGFFKTAYNMGWPFLRFGIAGFITIAVAETLHHLPGLGVLNTTGFDAMGAQLAVFAAGAVIYVLLTALSSRRAQERFEKIDL